MSDELVFAIGDVHGRLDLLKAALGEIASRAEGRNHRLMFLGDYVDRGPHARGVVELLLELQKDRRVVCLKGNHEALMVQALTSGRQSDFDRWMKAGGKWTVESYGAWDLETAIKAVPGKHIRWMTALPLTSGDGHRIYVHAGLMPDTPLERQTDETCLWIRERFLRAGPWQFDSHVVHGHTPARTGEGRVFEPELLPHRTNLDLATYWSDSLGVGVFDSGAAGGPVEVLIAHGALGEPVSVSARPGIPRAQRDPDEGRARRRGWARFWRSRPG